MPPPPPPCWNVFHTVIFHLSLMSPVLYAELYYIQSFYLAVAAGYICSYLRVCVLFVFSNCSVLYTVHYLIGFVVDMNLNRLHSDAVEWRCINTAVYTNSAISVLKFAYFVILWELFLCICHDWLLVTRLEAITEAIAQTGMPNTVLVDSYKISEGHTAYILRIQVKMVVSGSSETLVFMYNTIRCQSAGEQYLTLSCETPNQCNPVRHLTVHFPKIDFNVSDL
jgi:hypothetical protein